MILTEARGAWNELESRIRPYVARRVASAADVDDIVQEIFVRIHKKIDTLDDAERIDAWIFQIARNALIDWERVRATRNDARQLGTDAIETLATPEPDAAPSALVGCVTPMIATLPEPYREAIRLTEIEGLTQADAAERAGISLSGMKSRVQRGRERLKQMILDCCHVELDARGGVVDYTSRCSCGSRREPT